MTTKQFASEISDIFNDFRLQHENKGVYYVEVYSSKLSVENTNKLHKLGEFSLNFYGNNHNGYIRIKFDYNEQLKVEPIELEGEELTTI